MVHNPLVQVVDEGEVVFQGQRLRLQLTEMSSLIPHCSSAVAYVDQAGKINTFLSHSFMAFLVVASEHLETLKDRLGGSKWFSVLFLLATVP